ncbi:MAG TPA: alpha-glucuronidase family glycosyl hydrolase, partial [Silvibacterium sp.]|nr:alpha-glucuronidase family glycosyl hydrolase [Silvibacterium sp.]
MRSFGWVLLGTLLLAGGASSPAETGAAGWLRYAPIEDAGVKAQYGKLPENIVSLNDSALTRTAQSEMTRGI